MLLLLLILPIILPLGCSLEFIFHKKDESRKRKSVPRILTEAGQRKSHSEAPASGFLELLSDFPGFFFFKPGKY
jgi:hypothetical protein